MFKNRTAQLVYLSMACALGVIAAMASVGFFRYEFKKDFYVQFLMPILFVVDWIFMIFVAFVTVGYIFYALDKVSFKKKMK